MCKIGIVFGSESCHTTNDNKYADFLYPQKTVFLPFQFRYNSPDLPRLIPSCTVQPDLPTNIIIYTIIN